MFEASLNTTLVAKQKEYHSMKSTFIVLNCSWQAKCYYREAKFTKAHSL
jgi:hypothetical protein